jgi:cholest-4-en-3-one 26-monooxygenase
MFRLLRKEAPVFWNPEPEGPGFWVITKYDDVDHVSMHPETFSSGKGGAFIQDSPPEAAAYMKLLLINQDAPGHTRYRRLVSRAFTPKIVLGLEPHIRDVTNGIIDKIADEGECDFVTDVAADLPLQAIVELMGVPLEDRQLVFDWSNQMIGSEDPEYAPDPEIPAKAAAELFAYAQKIADERRKEPRDDIFTTLLQADLDGEALTQIDFNAFFLMLSVAGNETTRNAISHGMKALMDFPDQRQRLLDDPSMIMTAVDEILRWASPVMQFRRTATHDTEIRGVKIKEGDKVVIYYPSANRDEDIFPNADTFDIGRTPNPHVAFGPGGPHFCLGANLARLEIQIMFETLMRRLPEMEQTGPASYLQSNFIGGIKHLPVKYAPERN